MKGGDHGAKVLSQIFSSSLPAHAGAPLPCGRCRRVMTTKSSLIDDLERALAAGTNAQRVEMLSRVTDLFLAGASRYSDGQINLFDEVITKLTTAIESKARARLA